MNPYQIKTIGSSLRRLAASMVLGISASVIGIVPASLALCGAASAGIVTSDPSLPPNKGSYFTPTVKYILGPLIIELFDIFHFAFINIIRTPQGLDELENFDSTVTANLSINGGAQTPVTLTGSVETLVFGKTGNTTGTFQTEMLQLDLVAPGILVRESPTLASVGWTTITDIGGGLFTIDSFFDVFTELSIDGGLSWTPAVGPPEHVVLVPEPATLVLLGFGLTGIFALGVRRRRALSN